MRPGRPSSHVKPKWVTWRDDSKAVCEFYELDSAGKLVGGSSNFMVHHTRPLDSSVAIAPPVREAVYSAVKEPDPGLDHPLFDFQAFPDFDGSWDLFGPFM
jgi:hypothetical protein